MTVGDAALEIPLWELLFLSEHLCQNPSSKSAERVLVTSPFPRYKGSWEVTFTFRMEREFCPPEGKRQGGLGRRGRARDV